MSFAGKILVAKERNTALSVKMGVAPTSSKRFTNERTTINAGTVVMCVYEYKTPASVMEARNRGEPTIPYLFVLHQEKTWEVNPASYGIVEPSEILQGKSVCFTGEGKASREYWKTVVEACGGTNVSGVSRSTSLLVMQDKHSNNSTKAQMATKYGTQRMSYEEFQKMIAGGC